jgi:hypothetical protein
VCSTNICSVRTNCVLNWIITLHPPLTIKLKKLVRCKEKVSFKSIQIISNAIQANFLNTATVKTRVYNTRIVLHYSETMSTVLFTMIYNKRTPALNIRNLLLSYSRLELMHHSISQFTPPPPHHHDNKKPYTYT